MTIKLNEKPRYGGNGEWSYISDVKEMRVILVGSCKVNHTDDTIILKPIGDFCEIEPFNEGFEYMPNMPLEHDEMIDINRFHWRDSIGWHTGLFHTKGLYLLGDGGETIDRY